VVRKSNALSGAQLFLHPKVVTRRENKHSQLYCCLAVWSYFTEDTTYDGQSWREVIKERRHCYKLSIFPLLTKFDFIHRYKIMCKNIKFHEDSLNGSRVVPYGQTYRALSMRKRVTIMLYLFNLNFSGIFSHTPFNGFTAMTRLEDYY
jgi:hypothetical protein